MAEINNSSIVLSTVLRVTGISAKEFEKKIAPFLGIENTKLNLYLNDGEIIVRVRVKAATNRAASEKLELFVNKLCVAIGDDIYARDSENIESVLIPILYERHMQFSTSCAELGEYFNDILKNVENSESVYDFGSETFANDKAVKKLKKSKSLGEISEHAAICMAKLSEKSASSTFGIGCVHDDKVLCVAVTGGKRNAAVTIEINDENRSRLMQYAAIAAFDLVRRTALGLTLNGKEIAGAKRQTTAAEYCARTTVVNDIDESRKPIYENSPTRKKGSKGITAVLCIIVFILILICGYFVLYFLDMLPQSLRFDIFSQSSVMVMADSEYGTLEFDSANVAAAAKLNKSNDEVKGILYVPNTEIFEPTAQTDNNTFYTNHSYTGAISPGGAAFLDTSSSLEKISTNTVLYAGVLPQLNLYSELAGAVSSPGFAFYTPEGTNKYKLVSAFYVDNKEGLDWQKYQSFSSYHDYLEFILEIKSRSLYDMPVDILEGDSFLTLITNKGYSENSNLIVVGRKMRMEESPIVETAAISENATTIQPQSYYDINGGEKPDAAAAYAYWLSWYNMQNESNFFLQENIEMPEIDMPTVDVAPPAVSSSQSSQGSQGGSSSGSSQSGGSSSGSGSASTSSGTSSSSPSSTPSSTPSSEPTTPPPTNGGMLTVTMNGGVVTDTALNILSMVVANEMGYNFTEEAMKAQAVAAHSWILNQQQSSGIAAPTVVGRTPTARVTNAVAQVVDQVMVYNGAIIFSPYTASNAGASNSSQEVWGGYRPYLVSVPSIYDKDAPGFNGYVNIGLEEMRARLTERVPDADLSGDPSTWIEIVDYTSSGVYVGNMRIGGSSTFYKPSTGAATPITGRHFRESIVNGYGLRSSAFSITYADGVFTINTYGWGHGCGLSQWGAQLYSLNEGWSYSQILQHYYQGVTITTI